MPKASLRAVGPDDRVEVRGMSVAEAASGGTELELLASMRDRIATAVADPNCPPRDLAALTRRLREITKDIEALKLRDREERTGATTVGDEAFDAEAI